MRVLTHKFLLIRAQMACGKLLLRYNQERSEQFVCSCRIMLRLFFCVLGFTVLHKNSLVGYSYGMVPGCNRHDLHRRCEGGRSSGPTARFVGLRCRCLDSLRISSPPISLPHENFKLLVRFNNRCFVVCWIAKLTADVNACNLTSCHFPPFV